MIPASQGCIWEVVFLGKMFLKFSQNLHVITYGRVTSQIYVQVFSCEFCEIFKNIFSTEHLWMTASD